MYSLIGKSQVYYQRVGNGKDLIMIHGWGQDVSTFWTSVELLKDSFTLWIIDLPGFGRSDPPKKAYDTNDYSKIIVEFIKKNSLKKPSILGHSFGGKVSIKIAANYPNIIDKLVIVCSSGIKPDPSLKGNLTFPLAKIVHFLVPDLFNIKSIIRKKFYKRLESDYIDAGIMKDSLIKTLKEDLTSDLKKINNKTLIIWGEQDRAVPLKYGIRMYQLIENAKLIIVEGMGHFLHVHDPERFTSYVKDFI